MKILIYIFYFSLFSFQVLSNETEVIELHENLTLDQIVLEKLDEDISINDEKLTLDNSDSNSEDAEITNNTSDEENVGQELVTESTESVIEEIQISTNFFTDSSISEIDGFLNNTKKLNSKVLQNEFSNFLQNLNLDYDIKKNKEIYFLIVKYFYETGNISRAYALVNNIEGQENLHEDFFTTIKLNYLLSTFQLEMLCEIRNESNISLENYLIEKIDIFCEILEGNISEAELLNSILIDTEKAIDQKFQDLYSIISGKTINNEIDSSNYLKNLVNNNLIFLYGAMARIAEIPLNKTFLSLDPKNLAIPIILNRSTPISLRIDAANQSFKNNIISIESLAALYQSVDFNSDQLNNPEQTLDNLEKNTELTMAYFFQLINVQIFPSERLQAILNFWSFANKNNLEQIAYALTYQTVESIEITAENLEYSTQIATSYIYNNDFKKALSWLEFYELTKGKDEKSSYVRILLNLYSSNDILSLINLINSNFSEIANSNIKENKELIFILLDLVKVNQNNELNENLDLIYEDRLMPSMFLINIINETIDNQNNDKFLIYSAISLNKRKWSDIHPQFLKLLLSGYLKYKNGILTKEIILEIFKDYKII